MNETANPGELPPVLPTTGKPAPPLRYGWIWLFNALATGLAVVFCGATSMGTIDDVGAIIWGVLASLPAAAGAVIIGTGVFLATKGILEKKAPSSTASRWWLSGPAWIFALAVFAYGVWCIMPQQRLAKVCGGRSIRARNIQVVGRTGLQMGEWLAVCEVQASDFEELVRKQQLQPDSPESFAREFDRVVMLRDTGLYAGRPAAIGGKCFKREFFGGDGLIHGGVYASYDAKTSRAVVLRKGY